jgi:hypothetical protein
MTKRTLPLVLVLLLALVGCQGDDGGQAATATTTTVAPTTTTRPDPAEEGCRTFRRRFAPWCGYGRIPRHDRPCC